MIYPTYDYRKGRVSTQKLKSLDLTFAWVQTNM